MSAGLVILATLRFVENLPITYLLLIIVGSFLAFYIAWHWVFVERPAELDRKIPISSQELRRRKKQFYDSLR